MFREGSWNHSVEERLGVISSLSSSIQELEDANIINRLTTAENDIDSLQLSVSGLGSRLDTAEGDIDSLEGRVSSLESWRSAKATAIPDIGTTASADSVTILGISVPTNSSYMSLVSAHNGVKDKVNSILSTLRTREIIAV